jgi:hypothetical protein
MQAIMNETLAESRSSDGAYPTRGSEAGRRGAGGLNLLFTLTSLSVVLVTVERVSPTTRVVLAPHRFLSLHEVLQVTVLITLTVAIPALMLRVLSGNFAAVQSRTSGWLFIVFLVGTYYYGAGEGLHEVSSYTFNAYCDTVHLSGNLCGGLFFNDFFTGNTLFFVGAALTTGVLLIIESRNPGDSFSRRAMMVLVVNAVVFSATVIAYAAFDRVLVGLVYSLVMLVVSLVFLLRARNCWRQFPYTTYTSLVYTIGAVASVIIRIAR